ncbi:MULTISPECIES: hypothetical protein [Kitasatospora]|uniref:Uncharacterized protein n=2 Tax=Kitasatospora TaxID=2063 RepID=A0ABT1IWH0_9ACTN|nr:hypothetical protein [Kitasatospora paracochleata]MCP2309253.1 hypothetical protein [Kitasatospora paracochleata]
MTSTSSTVKPTFADLIARHGADIAGIVAAANSTGPVDTTALDPQAFTALVREAADFLETLPMNEARAVAENLTIAAGYLHDALGLEGDDQHVVLRMAKPLLDTADGICVNLDL